MAASPEARWFKSSYSGGSGTECVECAYATEGIRIRDSKDNERRPIQTQQAAWDAFVRAVGSGGLTRR
ncbi:DUF397 domain-containing protein [Streptomyces sp. NRRL S-340]|uniref:DUF397 domain-containing protein n=1 Tax=Streptomyces sp. NRRL S-340 TaxID=1463901 RepID=UPI00099B4D92|nr:DUF397 domain-containing protein [Streptomyces sp. NRRL S-340]